MNINIKVRHEIGVRGKDLRQIRKAARVSLRKVAGNMAKLGWLYYPQKLHALESQAEVFLPSREMLDLLKCIGADLEIDPQEKEKMSLGHDIVNEGREAK